MVAVLVVALASALVLPSALVLASALVLPSALVAYCYAAALVESRC